MSCRQTVSDLVDACVDWADETSADCSAKAAAEISVCVERAEEDIEQCAEEREERDRECDDWEWQGCDVPVFCDAAEALVGWVCTGWTWVTHTVCVGRTVIEAGTCLVWETVKNSACQLGTWLVRGTCEIGGAVAKFAICPVVDAVSIRILRSRDEPKARSVCRLAADAMSVAHVTTGNGSRDSGKRYFFQIRDHIAEFSSLTQGWEPIAAPGAGPQTISYHDLRTPIPITAPRFDMIAANSGRILVKEANYARFYVTLLEPMFRWGNDAIPSMYFKLDPEQGESTADNADRLVHLEVPDSPHPAAVRFELFRRSMQIDLNDSMIVNLDAHERVWHRVDARPPKDGEDPPDDPGFPPTANVVLYGSSLTRVLPLELLGHQWKKGYRIWKALDIGIGHEHWHEQRCSVYGGDMDSLDGPGLPGCLAGRNAYRLFNGPVEDQGGFIDGTVNYYVLAQFKAGDWSDDDTVPNDAFGILWLDEQAVLSERWRLLDPADFKFGLLKDIVPSAIVQYLNKDFRHFSFHQGHYWCPLRSGYVTPRSRMAVSRQVVIVSGRDPVTKHWELYSINASFGTWDRTWRWRALPSSTGKTTTPPEQFGLREDMTLFVRESAPEGHRTWFQRYLPASLALAPPVAALELDGEPQDQPARQPGRPKHDAAFAHCWQWLPSDVFDFCHRRLTHFGCFQDIVDWRWQYYRVTIEEGLEYIRTMPESTCWVDVDRRLAIRQDCLDWARVNALLRGEDAGEGSTALIQKLLVLASAIPGAISGALSASLFKPFFGALADLGNITAVQQLLCDIYREISADDTLVRKVHHRGLFNDEFLVSLRHREPFGFVMVHCDKRDDDLLPFEIPKPSDDPLDVVLRPKESAGASPRVVVRVHSHHPVLDIPRVTKAEVMVLQRGALDARLHVGLQPASRDVDENIWRLKIGFVVRDSTGECVALETCFDRVRLSAATSSIDATGWHDYEWILEPAAGERLAACCDSKTWRTFGTTLWFEDIVGHVGTADAVTFAVQQDARP